MTVHTRAANAQNGAVNAQNGAMEAHYGAAEAHFRAMEAHNVAAEVYRPMLQICITSMRIRIKIKKPNTDPYRSATSDADPQYCLVIL
jgi:hypothetical protein